MLVDLNAQFENEIEKIYQDFLTNKGFEYCEVCYGAYEQSEIESANQIKKNYNYEVRIN